MLCVKLRSPAIQVKAWIMRESLVEGSGPLLLFSVLAQGELTWPSPPAALHHSAPPPL